MALDWRIKMDRLILNPMENDDSWSDYLELTSSNPSSIIYILPKAVNAVYVTNDDNSVWLDKYPTFRCNGIQREFVTVFDIYALTEFALSFYSYQPYDYNVTDDKCIDLLLDELREKEPKSFLNSTTDKRKNLLLSRFRFNRNVLDNPNDKMAQDAIKLQAELDKSGYKAISIASMPDIRKPMKYEDIEELRYQINKK